MINKNMNKNQKWDYELRKIFFFQLITKFGKYDKHNKPKREELDEFCRAFARNVNDQFGLNIGEDGGPHMQLAWATTTQDKVAKEYMYQFLASKVAAYDAGYIGFDDLPAMGLFEYSK